MLARDHRQQDHLLVNHPIELEIVEQRPRWITSTASALILWSPINRKAHVGSRASSTPGLRTIQRKPITARVPNQPRRHGVQRTRADVAEHDIDA
jgi:hypothetical protein